MAWKTVNAAQSTDARSQNAFRRFSNILMSHRNANGNIQYNPQDKSYRLVNDNGIFYSNGRFFSKSGIKGNYNVETGSILNKRGTRPSTPSKQQPSTKPKNAVPWKTAPVYSGVDIMTTEDTDYTPSTRQTTFYPTSWKDNEKDFTRVDQQTQGNSAYILRPNSQTLWKPEGGSNQKESSKSNVTKPQVTKNSKAPELPAPTYNRSQTRDYMRSIGMNPYDYSGSERKALRTYLNNPGSMDSKYQPFIDQVQNQRTQKMVNSIGTNQLLKPETDTNKLNNWLVNLKFEKGGQMYKYSAGAQMVQPQQASGQQGIEQQAMTLVQAAMQGDQQANQTIQKIMQAAQQGDQQAAQVAKLLQAIVQQMKGSRKARLGAKLDYIKQSIGECPEGQEVVYFKKGGEICKICAGKKMQDGGKSDPIKNFKKKKDVAKQTYQRNPYTRGKSAKEIAEMQRRNRQEASAGKGENDANVAPWNYKKKKMK